MDKSESKSTKPQTDSLESSTSQSSDLMPWDLIDENNMSPEDKEIGLLMWEIMMEDSVQSN